MSLRLRLFLSFLTVALVMTGMGVVALRQGRQIQRQATDLTSISIARFEHDRSVDQSLEIEVDAGPNGTWRADEIEVLGGARRPKLRGPLELVEVQASRVQLYGQSIGVPEAVIASDLTEQGLAGLAIGDRVEVSCTINPDGTWVARKIRFENLKASNKVKGVVTAVAMDGVAPDTIAISGIEILIDLAGRAPNPRIELKRITLATRMTHLAQDCLLAARRVHDEPEATILTRDGEVTDAATILTESTADLVEAVKRARQHGQPGATNSLGLDEALWLDPLARQIGELEKLTATYLDLAAVDRTRAGALLFDRLEPLLLDEMRPLIHGYSLEAEERLAQEVDHLSTQAGTTAKAMLVASGLTLFTALALGWGVWRSMAAPLQRLSAAATRMGQGRLDTRVQVTGRDEFGMLGETLNHMAAELESTTVSIANLDDILESMAGALFVLDEHGAVLSTNRAAAGLVGRDGSELLGRPLHELFEPVAKAVLLPTPGQISSGEAQMLGLEDGGVRVSYSGAALNSGEGPAGGFVWIAQDLSQRLAMEEKLRGSLAEKELLLREVHHRVKNNLQVISSLLALQGDSIADPQARAVYADSQARIRSMALIHQQLYGASTLDRIDFGNYLQQLAGSLFQFHVGVGIEIVVEASREPTELGIDRALTCGLIVNELVTNALKHAYAPAQTGTVRISFDVGNGGHVLTVADDGAGLAADSGDPDSLGMSLVTALVEQLSGTMKIETGPGTTFVIKFPREDPV